MREDRPPLLRTFTIDRIDLLTLVVDATFVEKETAETAVAAIVECSLVSGGGGGE